MNNIDRQYKELLLQIIHFGVDKKDRTGTGTKSIFGWQIRHNMKEGFPLLTTKKMAWKTMVTELLWFLRGDTNIKFLVDNGCHIWDGDAYKNYLHKVIRDKDIVHHLKSYSIDTNGVPTIEPYSKDEFIDRIKNDDEFAKKWGELGPIYGKQWRKWERKTSREEKIVNPGVYNIQIDQIQNLIDELKTNPDSRRLMVSAWNVGELNKMVLPPCHYGFQIYTRELSTEERHLMVSRITDKMTPKDLEGKEWVVVDNMPYKIPTRGISLMYNTRSQDVPLGTPFNIASYALLLVIIAKQVNMVPDELITNMGDCHIYHNQIEGVVEQLTRTPYDLPTVKIVDKEIDDISKYEIEDFILENYQYHPSIKIPLSN